MKRLIYLFTALLLLASCQQEQLPHEGVSGSDKLSATMEQLVMSRTSMDEKNNVLWSEEDQIVAFLRTTRGQKYQVTSASVGRNTADFVKVTESESGDGLFSGMEIGHIVALYPYSSSVDCSMNGDDSYKLNFSLPQTQYYSESSFGNGAFPMLAVSSDNNITFRNICGGLKLQFKGVDKIKSITLEGLGDEVLSGSASVIGHVDGSAPEVTMSSSAAKSVTLDCGDGVQLYEDQATTFIITLPPMTFKSGMKLTVTDTDGLSKTLTNSSSNTVKRSSLLTFPVITYKQDGVLEFPEGAVTSFELPAEGGTVEIAVMTNQGYEVVIPDEAKDWINVVETKALHTDVVTLAIQPNTTTYERSAQVSLVSSDGQNYQTIAILQDAAAELVIDDSQFDSSLYLTYTSNTYRMGSGNAFDYDIYIYSSYIYNQAFASATKVEYKFQLASVPTSNCYLSVVERGDSTYDIYFDSEGLTVIYNSFTWQDLGVNPTDVIVLSFDGNTMLVNGQSFTLSRIYRGGYIFSGYYYDRDDGVYSKYYSFQDDAKLFYAKGWDADGNLIYLGGPSVAVGPSKVSEACWKSTYIDDNQINTKYDFAYYASAQEYTPYGFGNLLGPETLPADLSASGTANSYIVSEAGSYKFTPTKGNSGESVGEIASAEVLWEAFGTDVTPNKGDLVKNVMYKDGTVYFETPSEYKEGNALVAAKDASGKILWSWHIWLTDQPEGHVYYNNAGIMMDRNLGATSATPGDVGALGLLYQWGRKDPFLSSSSVSSSSVAASTATWPAAVTSDEDSGTIEYAVANPMTFIVQDYVNYDWYYTGSTSTDNTRWTTSATQKSIYDPCPAGWRVPDGGKTGVWVKASKVSANTFDNVNKGMNFYGIYSSSNIDIWYPATGSIHLGTGELGYVGTSGGCWSASPDSNTPYNVYRLFFSNRTEYFAPMTLEGRANGVAVRCLREPSMASEPSEDPELEYEDLSVEGTANSYIVSSSGAYKFTPTKGNSSESVGAIASAEVVWETFGTDVTPNKGDLVRNVTYQNGAVYFETPSEYKEGNALVAAKDASGKILWSWHIWLTDEPQGQVYYNNAGTMMDRNLGATSATPGDVGALGLLYQWGRKDPFLGSSSISEGIEAKSTITWPSVVTSNPSIGTIAYATANPTAFITYNSNNYDWYYTGSLSTDNTRWTTSDTDKSIYDPCPAGWRVPDGGSNGVWFKAFGSSSVFYGSYDNTNEGMNFSGKFGADETIWYPASGYGSYNGAVLNFVGYSCNCWSASPDNFYADGLNFDYERYVYLSCNYLRAYACSVRCIKE